MKETRKILAEERALIVFLLEDLKSNGDTQPIPDHCQTMNDGEMGSISFDLSNSADYGADLIQGKYTDADKVPVFITLTGDKSGNLYELDFWKANFGKLKKYPEPGEVTKVPTARDKNE